ncbi:MAG: RNA polymerase sigma factor [Firmicutes bacterium]|nr:RNA polymerase sigma factor [Bacillota bacterium]
MKEKNLIPLLKAHDEAAFTEVYNRYHRIVFHVILGITGNQSDAEDQTQETFIKMFTKIDQFDGNQNFKYWLLTVAKNTALDFVKKKASQIHANMDIEKYQDDLIEENNYKPIMGDYAGFLDEEEFDIILLHLYHGLSFKEIAELRNKTVSAVNNKFDRGIKKIRKGVKSNGK